MSVLMDCRGCRLGPTQQSTPQAAASKRRVDAALEAQLVGLIGLQARRQNPVSSDRVARVDSD